LTEIVRSVNNVPIRLTDERWDHIVERHIEPRSLKADVLICVQQPEEVRAGRNLENLAIHRLAFGKLLVVVYHEISSDDGFIVTAFLTYREQSLVGRPQLWP
jgi:hypothetical protein